jgi:hypothetical protein
MTLTLGVALAALAAAPGASATAPTPSTLLPWSFEAHRLICEIAWRELTPAVRDSVTVLLANDRPYERFSDACIWADQIRADPAYARYETAHYMNVPPGRSGADPAVDCAETYCVLEAIRDLTRAVADRSLSRAERRDALRFLLHFVADLHQPLHVGRPDDRGGNDVPVRFLAEDTNLHTLWDAGLVQRAMLDPWDARRLSGSITPSERETWADLDPVTWANESYEIVERSVYRGVTPGARLDDAYADTHRDVIERRIVQAGFRLGMLLNQLLGS